MKITVITACFNAETTIADCIASVAQQTHSEVEHWIVDGASTDRTHEIIEANRNDRMQIHSEKDDGIYDALNRGIELATGDVIGFLNADDVYENERVLETVASVFRAEEALDGCYSDLVYVKADDLQEVVRFWKSSPFSPGIFKRGWMPPHPTFFARREVYEKLGGFDTSLSIGSDWEFLMRFFEKEKLQAAYVPETWIRMRLGGVSNASFRNVLRNNLDTWKACRKAFGFWPSLLFPVYKFIHRSKQFVNHG